MTTILVYKLAALLIGTAVLAVFFLRFGTALASNWLLDALHSRMYQGGDPVWDQVQFLLNRAARRARLPVPELRILKEFAPNAGVFPLGGGKSAVLLTEGLVQALSERELISLLALCIARIRMQDTRRAVWVAAALWPFAYLISLLPEALRWVTEPVLAGLLRLFLRPQRFFRADLQAQALADDPTAYINAMQKCASLARNMPLDAAHVWSAPLWLFSSRARAGEFWRFFPTHPPVEERVEKLLRRLSIA